MASALPLRAALKRGALVTAANWPIVLIDFAIESLYKFALGVPVVGGAFMVAVLVGDDVRTMLEGGLRSAAEMIISSLGSAPAALVGFLVAVGIVALGGALIMFPIKAGTLAVLVAGERAAPEIERPPLRGDLVRRAGAFSLAALTSGVGRFARRAATLTIALGVAYVAIALGWVGVVTASLHVTAETRWAAAWPLVVLLATSAAVIAVAVVNLVYDLLRVVVVSDDCGVGAAATRLRAFLLADTRQVLGIFAVVTVLVLLALAASVPVLSSLTFLAWVPVAGLIALPLQLAGWLVRGLVFQYVALAALAAYQTQYRRFADSDGRSAAGPRRVQPA
jgi:hypothetical protein